MLRKIANIEAIVLVDELAEGEDCERGDGLRWMADPLVGEEALEDGKEELLAVLEVVDILDDCFKESHRRQMMIVLEEVAAEQVLHENHIMVLIAASLILADALMNLIHDQQGHLRLAHRSHPNLHRVNLLVHPLQKVLSAWFDQADAAQQDCQGFAVLLILDLRVVRVDVDVAPRGICYPLHHDVQRLENTLLWHLVVLRLRILFVEAVHPVGEEVDRGDPDVRAVCVQDQNCLADEEGEELVEVLSNLRVCQLFCYLGGEAVRCAVLGLGRSCRRVEDSEAPLAHVRNGVRDGLHVRLLLLVVVGVVIVLVILKQGEPCIVHFI